MPISDTATVSLYHELDALHPANIEQADRVSLAILGHRIAPPVPDNEATP